MEETKSPDNSHDILEANRPIDEVGTSLEASRSENNDTEPAKSSHVGNKTETEVLTSDGLIQSRDKDNKDDLDKEFVIVEPDENFRFEQQGATIFAQMEAYLLQQLEKCQFYKKFFEQQCDSTKVDQFGHYETKTIDALALLRRTWQNSQLLPRHEFMEIELNCMPINVDTKDKELKLEIRTVDLPSGEDGQVYAIAEFEFPHPVNEPLMSTFTRWLHYVRIDLNNLFRLSHGLNRQLDIVYASNTVTFYKPDSRSVNYNRPVSFFVDKGKSRTLKRKFKPIKLTFFEKTNFCTCDKKLGSVLVRIDEINDECTIVSKLPVMDGRKQTKALAKIKVKVREPLVNKSTRPIKEKLLLLLDQQSDLYR